MVFHVFFADLLSFHATQHKVSQTWLRGRHDVKKISDNPQLPDQLYMTKVYISVYIYFADKDNNNNT